MNNSEKDLDLFTSIMIVIMIMIFTGLIIYFINTETGYVTTSGILET